MTFFTMYSDFDHYVCIGFDDIQMKRIFGDDPRQRFDYTQGNRPFKRSIPEKLNINFQRERGSKSGAKLPDIQVLTRHNTNLFLSLTAYDVLKDIIADAGEFIPVSYEEGDGYIFNVLCIAEDVDGLDMALCIKNDWGDVENMGFREENLKSLTLFKTKFDGFNNLYCREDVKAAIENAGLWGVLFSPDLGTQFGMTQGQKASPH